MLPAYYATKSIDRSTGPSQRNIADCTKRFIRQPGWLLYFSLSQRVLPDFREAPALGFGLVRTVTQALP